MLSRRSFLTRATVVAGTASIGFAPHIGRSSEHLLAQLGQKPKRIIHIVSDGMSMGTLTCADLFSQLTRKRPLSWTQLFKTPVARHGLMNTRSLNSLVTDSAAASSAWGSGTRVVNGALNVLPDGQLLTPLYSLLATAGWKTGLVTTAEITHATPAGFAVAMKSRGKSERIAAQYLERKVDILLGGGRPFFSPRRRKDKHDLRADFTAAGYTIAFDKNALAGAPLETRLLGTFSDGHLPYTIDHRASAKFRDTIPTLVEMTRAALVRLERHEKFILQVEGARIDHAAHNSDAAAAVHDQIALDEALDACIEFQSRNPDTLLVITTDHGNSNLGLNGMGGGYGSSSQRFATLAEVKMSFPEILRRLEKAGKKVKFPEFVEDPEDKLDVPDPMAKVDPDGKVEGEKEPEKTDKPIEEDGKGEKDDDKEPADGEKTKFTAAVKTARGYRVEPKAIREIIGAATGYKMSERRAALFSKVMAGEHPQLFDQMNSVVTQLGQVLANRVGIGWTGNTHTADYVPIIAIGPGSEHFAGFLENTDIFHHYTAFAGIDFRNVTAPLIADGGPEADEAELPARYAIA